MFFHQFFFKFGDLIKLLSGEVKWSLEGACKRIRLFLLRGLVCIAARLATFTHSPKFIACGLLLWMEMSIAVMFFVFVTTHCHHCCQIT